MALALPPALVAQPTGEEPASVAQQATRLTAEKERIEKDPELPEEERKSLLALYEEAGHWLGRASEYREKRLEYTRARTELPQQTAALRAELSRGIDSRPLSEKKLLAKPLDELTQLVETQKADLVAREAQVAELESELSALRTRPDEARRRLAEAKQQLESLHQKLTEQPPGEERLRLAQWRRDSARARALEEEVRMLEQEMLSLPARRALLEARLEEARARLGVAEERVKALEKLLNERRRSEAEKLTRAEEAAQEAVAGRSPLLEALAAENAALSERLKQITRRLEQVSVRDNRIREQAKLIREMYSTAREKVELAGLSEALGQVLLEQRFQLPDRRDLERDVDRVRRRINEVSLRHIGNREELRRLRAEAESAPEWPGDLSAAERARLEPERRKLLERKRELLEKLVAADREYVKALTELEVALQRNLQTVQQFDDFLAEHLLWVRNTRALRLGDFARLPREIGQLLVLHSWLDMWQQLARQFMESPPALAVLILLLLFTALRGRVKQAILRTGDRAARPGLRNFTDTISALLLSLLLAAWPLLWAAFLYWQLREISASSAVAFALADALRWVTPPFYSLWLARVLSMQGGLLQAHFRWQSRNLKQLRAGLNYLIWIFLPASFLTVLTVDLVPGGLASVLVKLDFVLIAVALSLFIFKVFHPARGVIASYIEQHPHGYLSRLRWLWFPLAVGLPLGLVILTLAGYVYTAASLLGFNMDQLWLIGGLVLLHQLVESWLLLTRRRLAYKAALERRRALEEERLGGEEPSAGAEREAEAAEAKVDLVTLSNQSRRLLNAIIFITGVVGTWFIWAPMIPALGVLDEIALWHHTVTVEGHKEQVAVTLGSVLTVVAIIFATVLAARNLPSLIEILLLQYLRISAGSRYTIRTLSGYLIAAFGIVAVFYAMGGDWAQIQWLVAALSVGIGFGLQEIVANFISGLIILFERPIRVGDFVTVGDTDGIVSRIRIRATTIVTRDRKELLVPNKEFITGRLLNWTLSDQTTRIKLALGIRYGADVVLAEKIMLEAAREHPQVLAEPAPWVNFDDFGDNALILELRCICESADNRVQVESELRHAIDRGFRAADMEIPFPQRDVHLDTTRPLEVRLQRRE